VLVRTVVPRLLRAVVQLHGLSSQYVWRE